MPEVTSKLSLNAEKSLASLDKITKVEKFQRITFDVAVLILTKNSFESLIVSTTSGRDITAKGEVELMKILNTNLPIWITDYDRDRVPFYQKPNPKNTKSVINGDLIFPSLIKESFGGEIVGAGQRQDDVQEIYESLKRQNVSSESYEWYINIRKLNNYKTTSGFGIGIERFITWALCRDDIKEAILYPRLKNVKTLP
jgi:asparaginyl-tRNA synthetase